MPQGGRLQSASGRRPGTASRLVTAKQSAGNMRSGQGVALDTQLRVEDRITTQQGLGGGLKTGQKTHRMVEDRTFWANQLRLKMQELTSEINRLNQEHNETSNEQSQYVIYERKAETLAKELQKLQAEMADYNTLVDKLATDSDTKEILADIEDLKIKNSKDARGIESLFEKKTQLEQRLASLTKEIDQEKQLTDNLVAGMDTKTRQIYESMNKQNENYLNDLEKLQQTLDDLSVKKEQLEQELQASPTKLEAVRMMHELKQIEAKRDAEMKGEQERGTPEQQRDKLLAELKQHNQEIASMERQMIEMEERMSSMKDEIIQLDTEIETGSSEKQSQYKELRKREEMMDQFMTNFNQTKIDEDSKLRHLEEKTVTLLEQISSSLSHATAALPKREQFDKLKQDLEVKTTELGRSETTATGLSDEHYKLQSDLQKIEQLENKVTRELAELKTKKESMSEELGQFKDLNSLKEQADARKEKLSQQRIELRDRHDKLQTYVKSVADAYEAQSVALADNEIHKQLKNLEARWAHMESTVFALKDQISAKAAKTDYSLVATKVTNIVGDWNQKLQQAL